MFLTALINVLFAVRTHISHWTGADESPIDWVCVTVGTFGTWIAYTGILQMTQQAYENTPVNSTTMLYNYLHTVAILGEMQTLVNLLSNSL